MMQTMKQENTSPRGHLLDADPEESKTGVHKKTKMYITDSNLPRSIRVKGDGYKVIKAKSYMD